MSFAKQLQRQLRFIQASCDAFDQGAVDESLRIAVALRVIFHDTRHSVSLLRHLEGKEAVQMLSTFDLGWRDLGEGRFSAGSTVWAGTSGRFVPLDATLRREFVSVDVWWQEIIMGVSNRISRKDVILAAANEDGGAHVDAKPGKKTLELKVGVGTFVQFIDGERVEENLDNHHLYLLRQIGYEVLSSPQLLELSRSPISTDNAPRP